MPSRVLCLYLACNFAICEETTNQEWPFLLFSTRDESTIVVKNADSIESQLHNAYSTGQKLPPGCQCVKTGESDRDCSQFDCTCICDLTAGVCDHNCCCDKECSAVQQDRLNTQGDCLHEGPLDTIVTKCYSTKEVDRVNPKFPLTVRGLARASLDRMLCVRYDNSDLRGRFYNVEGRFYSDPSLSETMTVINELSQNQHGYSEWKQTTLAGHAPDKMYGYGDPIHSAYLPGNVSMLGGVLPLPAPTQLGECSEFGQAQFFVSEARKCLRVINVNSLEAACKHGPLNTDRLSHQYLGRRQASASLLTDDEWTQIAVRTVKWRNVETGDEVDFGAYVCQSFYDTSGLSRILNGASESFSGPTCDAGIKSNITQLGACQNAIASIAYTILYHPDNNNIVAAYADIVLADVPLEASNSYGHVVLEQEFSILFQSVGQIPRSQSLANFINRSKSGNPGYIFGRPLLAGTSLQATDEQNVVIPGVRGLELLGADASGSCSGLTPYKVTLPFGVDVRSGCSLKMNLSELHDFCRSRTSRC